MNKKKRIIISFLVFFCVMMIMLGFSTGKGQKREKEQSLNSSETEDNSISWEELDFYGQDSVNDGSTTEDNSGEKDNNDVTTDGSTAIDNDIEDENRMTGHSGIKDDSNDAEGVGSQQDELIAGVDTNNQYGVIRQ